MRMRKVFRIVRDLSGKLSGKFTTVQVLRQSAIKNGYNDEGFGGHIYKGISPSSDRRLSVALKRYMICENTKEEVPKGIDKWYRNIQKKRKKSWR